VLVDQLFQLDQVLDQQELIQSFHLKQLMVAVVVEDHLAMVVPADQVVVEIMET
jgi:hypothetical protein